MRVTTVARLIAGVPPGTAAACARIASPVAALLSPRRTEVWRSNLRAVGLDPVRPWIPGRIPLYHHLLLLYESLALAGGREFAVEVRGERFLHEALSQGRGVLIATAHVGNWNLGARLVRDRTGLPVHSVAGTQMLRAWTAGLRLSFRRFGLRIHPRRSAGPRLIRALRRGEIVALHLDGDQHAGLGPATRGIALLSRRTGAPIVPALSQRSAAGSLTVSFRRHLETGDGRPGPEELRMLLFDLVRERPEQWILFRPLREER